MIRGKFFRFVVVFALVFSFFLAISSKSPVNNATIPTLSPSITPGSPLVILLDNSGSMGKCSQKDEQGKCLIDQERPYRIDIVKEAVRKRINQPDLASTNIGLVEVGNYRNYGLSKEKSCEAVKTISGPKSNNTSTITQGLNQIQANDDGTTPIAYAIQSVVYDLEANKLLPGRILLITDGEPNCKKETKNNWVCGIIGSLVNNQPPVDIKVDVIGYKATGKDQEFFDCAEKYPGVFTYWGSANNPQELERKIEDAIPHSNAPKAPLTKPTITLPPPTCPPNCPPPTQLPS